jgi:hypothetical protein
MILNNSNSNYKTSISLGQGMQFNKYIGKIDSNPSSSIEAFTTASSLSDKSNDVLKNTNPNLEVNHLLMSQYKETIKEIEKVNKQLIMSTKMYHIRTHKETNPYLGKNISIGDKKMYVTEMGIAKLYPNETIWKNTAGINGCPSINDVTPVDLKWKNIYRRPGVKLRTDPHLITGTHMRPGQACGFEGTNVFVNKSLTQQGMASSYVGTYDVNNTTPLSWLGAPPPINIDLRNWDFSCPKIAANSHLELFEKQRICGVTAWDEGAHGPGKVINISSTTTTSAAHGDPAKKKKKKKKKKKIRLKLGKKKKKKKKKGASEEPAAEETTETHDVFVVEYDSGVVLINNSKDWGYTMPYPQGDQALSIQGVCAFSFRPVYFNANTSYYLSFWACGRPKTGGSNSIQVGLLQLVNGMVSQSHNQPITWISFNGSTDAFTSPTDSWTQYNSDPIILQSNNLGNQKLAIKFQGNNSSDDYATAIAAVTLIENDPKGGQFDFNTCKNAAVWSGNKYFALTGIDPTSNQGFCGVTNDYISATSPGISTTVKEEIVLWSSNTNTTTVGLYAQLTTTGQLAVYDEKKSILWESTIPTEQSSWSSYYGTYGDDNTRMLPTAIDGGSNTYDFTSCLQKAQDQSAAYFGLQDVDSSGNAQCFIGSDFGKATSLGLKTNPGMSSDMPAGGGWANSIYNVSGAGFNSFVMCQDDGNVVVCRGQSPTDNQGQLWSADTTGKQQDSASKYQASAGITGVNWMNTSTILKTGDFIGNTSGNIALVMQDDGNLAVLTFKTQPNEFKDSNGNTSGGPGGNALYEIKDQAYSDLVGKVAYIDENGFAHVYHEKQLGRSKTYTESQPNIAVGIDSFNLSKNGSQQIYENISSSKDCETTCNKYKDCFGFTYINDTCYLKDHKTPFRGTGWLNDAEFYAKNKSVRRAPAGAGTEMTLTDSNQFNKYFKTDINMSTKFGLAKYNLKYHKKLEELQKKLNEVGSLLGFESHKFDEDTEQVLNRMQNNTSENSENESMYYYLKKKIDSLFVEIPSTERILEETGVNLLTDSYNYILWSLLAIGLTLAIMNIPKKK